MKKHNFLIFSFSNTSEKNAPWLKIEIDSICCELTEYKWT